MVSTGVKITDSADSF